MAFSPIAGVAASSSNQTDVTTGSVDTTGANLIVISVSSSDGTVTTVSDSKSNTWTPLTARNIAGITQRLYYCVSPTVGTGHTFSASGVGRYPGIAVQAFSGVNTSDAFNQESAGGFADDGTSMQPGSVTPDEDNCLVVTGIHVSDPDTAINSGYTAETDPGTPAQGVGAGIAYLIQTTATATNPTWSWTNVQDAAGSAAVFHAAAGGGGGESGEVNPHKKIPNEIGREGIHFSPIEIGRRGVFL